MKSFAVFAAVVGSALCAPADPYTTSGLTAGPLTAAFGDLASTKRGLRPVSLEGFSEDVNQDGFVDPVGQAVAPAVVHAAPVVAAAPAVTYAHAPFVHHAPVVHAAAVKAVEVKPVEVKAVAPVVHHAPVVHAA